LEEASAGEVTLARDGQTSAPPGNNTFDFRFTAVGLSAPEKLRFKYRLEPYEKNWVDVGTHAPHTTRTCRPENTRSTRSLRTATAFGTTGGRRSFRAAAALLPDERVLWQTVQGFMLRLQAVNQVMPQGAAKKELEETLEIGDRAIVEGRRTVQDLRSGFTTSDLAQSMRALGDELTSRDGAAFRLLVEGPVRDLNPIVRDEAFSIVREALRNAFTHVCASHIEAEITFDERLLRLRIRQRGHAWSGRMVGGCSPFWKESLRNRRTAAPPQVSFHPKKREASSKYLGS
jgi:hypothetical protein